MRNIKTKLKSYSCIARVQHDSYLPLDFSPGKEIKALFLGLESHFKTHSKLEHEFLVSPVNPKLLFVIRRPRVVLLLGWIVGFMQQHVHQLEVNWPVDLQVNGLLLLLE